MNKQNMNNSDYLKSVLLEIANESKHIFPVMMPIKDIQSKKIIGYEFFIRSEVSEISIPEKLFKKAIQYNLTTAIDYACFKICLGSSEKVIADKYFINILPETLMTIPPERILKDITAYWPFEQYCLEISEIHMIDNPLYLLDTVNALKVNGIQIALDNVGFGKTCLDNLIILKPDIIMISRNCTVGIGSDIFLQDKMKMLIKVINALDIKNIIVEGIETIDDLDYIRELPVKHAQGFIWGKPVKCKM